MPVLVVVTKTLFDGSEETPGLKGLGVIPGMVACFDPAKVCPPYPLSCPVLFFLGNMLQKNKLPFRDLSTAVERKCVKSLSSERE